MANNDITGAHQYRTGDVRELLPADVDGLRQLAAQVIKVLTDSELTLALSPRYRGPSTVRDKLIPELLQECERILQ